MMFGLLSTKNQPLLLPKWIRPCPRRPEPCRQPATTPAVSPARSSQQPATTPPIRLSLTTTISSASASSAPASFSSPARPSPFPPPQPASARPSPPPGSAAEPSPQLSQQVRDTTTRRGRCRCAASRLGDSRVWWCDATVRLGGVEVCASRFSGSGGHRCVTSLLRPFWGHWRACYGSSVSQAIP
jgi:hypothetical protein